MFITEGPVETGQMSRMIICALPKSSYYLSYAKSGLNNIYVW